jgi:heme exporter protein D
MPRPGTDMNLGPHAAFIISAYAIATTVIGAVIAWVLLDYRRQLRILSELEESGVSRRSERVGAGKEAEREKALP